MTDASAIDAAAKRLALALDALEAALERRREADRGDVALGAQLQALSADRSRLAADLDAQVAQTRGVENASRDVMRRLDRAIDAVRSVLERQHH